MAQSFSIQARQEITRDMCQWECCARAELAAALCIPGGVSFRGPGRYALTISTGIIGIARYYVSLIKKYFGVSTDVRIAKSAQLGDHTKYEIIIEGEEARTLMDRLGLYDENAFFGVRSVPFDFVIESPCCRTAFLRSAFLISGYVANPNQKYSLEIAVSNEDAAEFVKKIMTNLELSAKIACRKSQFVVYLRNSEMISAFLTRVGCHSAVMSIENVKIIKDLRNTANRQMNCDTHNIDQALRTSEKQLEMIDEIDRKLGLETLPVSLQEMAAARREFPGISLEELGSQMDPPLGKSGVNARLRRIRKIYEDLME